MTEIKARPREPLSIEEIQEVYSSILSRCNGNERRARLCLERYLQGYEQGGKDD
jgi:hypothetical protein